MQTYIREAVVDDAPALGRIVIAATQTTFRGLVPEQCLAWLTIDESAANWQRFLRADDRHDGRFLYVVDDVRDGVVACALGGHQPDESDYHGELYLLHVLPAYQRHGLGQRLVGHVAARLSQTGIDSLLVRVLSINPNRAFYERLGACFLREQPYDWNGIILPEVVYGWRSTARLLEATYSAQL